VLLEACSAAEASRSRGPAPTSPPPEPDRFARTDCGAKQALALDLDHDGAPDRLVWTQCGPAQLEWAADGSLAYPVDALDLVASTGRSFRIYSNEPAPELEGLSELTPLRERSLDTRVLVRSTVYGSGNIQNWQVLDVWNGALRSLTDPTPLERVTALLGPGESIRKAFETGVRVLADGTLETAHLVYNAGDANCCPTAGLLKARLGLGPDGLVCEATWREPLPGE